MALNFLAAYNLAQRIGQLSNAAGELANALPWSRASYRQWCRIAAGTGIPQGLELIGLKSLCSPYLADDGRTFGEEVIEYPEGQCVGILYDFFVSRTGTQTNGQPNYQEATGQLVGPATFSINNLGGGFFSAGWTNSSGGGGSVSWFEGSGGLTNVTVDKSISRVDGQPDNCGEPTTTFNPGTGYNGEDYGDPFVYTDDDGRDWNITVSVPIVKVDGSIEIPVTVDGINVDLGDRGTGEQPPSEPRYPPDFDNPSDPIRPGDPGQPEDGIDYSGPVACAIVVVTTEPTNASQEIGGPEAVFIAGYNSDAGWYRFVKDTGTTEQKRITSRSTIACYCCTGDAIADGFQVKFSYGYDGYVQIIPPTEE